MSGETRQPFAFDQDPGHGRWLPRQPCGQLIAKPKDDIVCARRRHQPHLQVDQLRQLPSDQLSDQAHIDMNLILM